MPLRSQKEYDRNGGIMFKPPVKKEKKENKDGGNKRKPSDKR